MQLNLTEDYVPSDGEYNNLCYITCKYTAGWGMRLADLAVCKMMAEEAKGDQAIENFVRTTCEYVWDHICGEPDDVTPDAFYEHIEPMIEEWYKGTTPEERENIN
jgi:hypothetical protein